MAKRMIMTGWGLPEYAPAAAMLLRCAFKCTAEVMGVSQRHLPIALKKCEEKFGYSLASSIAAGSVIQGWAEQKLPAPSMTTFRFLCFYGMNRTLAVLTIATIPPVAHWSLAHSHFCCMIIVILAGIIFAGMFIYQYLRFVEYYADSIPELLLMEERSDTKLDSKKDVND